MGMIIVDASIHIYVTKKYIKISVVKCIFSMHQIKGVNWEQIKAS